MKQLLPLLFDRRRARALAAGCVALAAGGIVLLRAPHGASAPIVHVTPPAAHGAAPQGEFSGPFLHGRVALSQGRVTADGAQHVYAEIRMTGDEASATAVRRPVSLAVVLDTSGSMTGEKIADARRAVLDLVDRMRDDDRVALVTYNDHVDHVEPLRRVADVRALMHTIVPNIEAAGGTNIPAGLAQGTTLLSDAPGDTVRRIVLISDGRDGSGQTVDVIAQGVRGRADDGVTLSSLGVGSDYDEAFMTRVADAGRGNYEFLRDGAQLQAFLRRELDAATRTTVDRAMAEVRLPDGWRLERAYGVEAHSDGSVVRLPFGALAAHEERRAVLDLVVDPARARGGDSLGAMTTSVRWTAVPLQRSAEATPSPLALRVADSAAEALASRDVAVFADAESTAIAARQQDALSAWRDGRVADANRIAQQNVGSLQQLQAAAPSAGLTAQIRQYNQDLGTFNQVSANSESGRAYGLRTNAMHRRAMRESNSAAY